MTNRRQLVTKLWPAPLPVLEGTSVKLTPKLYVIDFKPAPIYCNSIATICNADFGIFNLTFRKIQFQLQNQIQKFNFQPCRVKTKSSLYYIHTSTDFIIKFGTENLTFFMWKIIIFLWSKIVLNFETNIFHMST